MVKSKKQTLSFRIHIRWNYEDAIAYNQREYVDRSRCQEENIFEKDLRAAVTDILPQMKGELNKFADGAIEEVKVQSIYEGSIIALFSVVWNTANTVKDAYDIAHMVRDVSELFAKGKLKEKMKCSFDVDTYGLQSERDRDKFPVRSVSTKMLYRRDTFFYYLLVANILEAIIIGALVFGAVMKVYF